ncbi:MULTISPECIES: 16S rRNA (uracil(1498)-N(3))-methyltransferase [unclassified Bacillus (in: firmicutes)]|uniref:16S rRNA (uracil(1498)-N(3))-methyltransferase n=1 Tax=unclassified Bacillus (in: firmicutes) TaxID=185979 RepID=UPI000BEF241F|nr:MULTISPECIES: 16S rRNA (uracil(1498)-N(3))-methyltransferase [unclassified Bacillus (in: firmicutes)]PEJ56420.1 16S rRNA (uracil(1498)-N(3))-methyltransferase [Bacillus sp. AFS002410]PEL14163.1 16S rRNA (uracil(1498)-N(3))-methyltransferase [Bacillus sp. AFS017336]
MQRYFIEETQLQNDTVTITGDDAHHIANVMRMKPEQEIICTVQGSSTVRCSLTNISSEQITAAVVEYVENTNELPISITIASGLPKGDKLELIIQKSTELGASSFLPFAAARSIVKLDDKKAGKKVERWQKIAKEAAEQSYRFIVPTVEQPVSFQQLLNSIQHYDACIVAYEESAKIGESAGLVQTFQSLKEGSRLLVVFGPEGGLSDKEVDQLEAKGAMLCGLGPRILRTETAPFYVLAAASFHFELMR